MRLISAPSLLSQQLKALISADQSVGFVPTMGALHGGHLKLIRRSKQENDLTVVSIFVNPTQFNNPEDLLKYPRDLESDKARLEALEVDVLFTPGEQDIYPQKPTISINFGKMAQVLEGKFREGHFEGVGIIVSKLLNLVQPTNAYFGLKDLQQYLLIKRMCEELNVPCRIVGVETEREANGLAMSSRNQRLSGEGVVVASSIFKGLEMIREDVMQGQPLHESLKKARNFYSIVAGLELEYLEAINPADLEPVAMESEPKELAVCIAGYVEGIRLIDNLYLRLK